LISLFRIEPYLFFSYILVLRYVVVEYQFETAEKAYHKAVEALDNGLTKLIARTEPSK